MALPMYKIRIMANAVITRYDAGEGTVDEILATYPALTSQDITLIKAEIAANRPDIPLT